MLSGEPATQRHLVEATNLDASDGPRVTYAPGPDATLEGESALRSRLSVYAVVVIQAHEQEKAAVSYDEDVEGR